MPDNLEILCTAYKRPALLSAQLWSLAAQTRKDFSINILHDGDQDVEVLRAVKEFQSSNPKMKVDLSFSGIRFDDWGHSLREIGLMNSNSNYMLITNDDNYYVPSFIERMMIPLENGFDISFCNMIHSHKRPNRKGLFKLKREYSEYQPLYCGPRLGEIDMGAFIFPTRMGQKIGFKDKSFAADGIFFERLLTQASSIYKVDEFLFVHN